MNPELGGMVAIFWIGQKPRCEVVDGEGDVAAVAHDFCADFDQLLLQACQ